MLGAACEKALIPKNYESNPKSQVRAIVIIIYSYTELVKYCAQYCIYGHISLCFNKPYLCCSLGSCAS